MIAHSDWMPTFVAAAGEPSVKEKLLQGYQANNKTFKVHLDGYNYLPFFRGEVKKGPRDEFFYFSQGGELNAVRWNDWKVHFAVQRGNIANSTRDITGWPTIINLRADPYEKGPNESGMYIRWYAENIWLFVPIQQKIKEFFTDIDKYPFQAGSSLNTAGINYQTLRAMEALKRLQQLEGITPPR
jgi:arylsulfatase